MELNVIPQSGSCSSDDTVEVAMFSSLESKLVKVKRWSVRHKSPSPLTYPQITRVLLGVKLWLHRNHYKVRVIITEVIEVNDCLVNYIILGTIQPSN